MSSSIYVTIFRKTNWLERNQLSHTRGSSRSSSKMLMEIKKKKSVLLGRRRIGLASNWMVASSLDLKGNKSICFSRYPVVFSKLGHIYVKCK